MDDKLKKLHAQYKDVPIPKELEIIIEKNLQRPHKKKRKLPIFLTSVAAAAGLLSNFGSPTEANKTASASIHI